MKFSVLGPIFFMLLLGIVSISGIVHNIPLVQRRILGKAAEHRIAQKRVSAEKLHSALFPKSSVKKAITQVKTFNVTEYAMVGNISVGTPAQNFIVEYDFFNESDLTLIRANATYRYYYTPSNTTKFNESNSSTFKNKDRYHFWNWHGDGHPGSDIVNIEGISTNLSFGIYDNVEWDFATYSYDGTLGLAGLNSTSYIDDNLITQLATKLDKPIVSLWTNFSYNSNGTATGTAQITLGALDKTHCQSKWAFAPKLYDFYNYVVNATSAVAKSANGSIINKVQGNLQVIVDDSSWHRYATTNLFSLLVNVSGAVDINSTGLYTTTCDYSKIGSIEINLGNDNQTDNRIVLTAADFIDNWSSKNACFINSHDHGDAYYGDGFIALSRQFLDNHCVAYNAATDQFGVANAIPANAKNSVTSTETDHSY